MRTSLDCIPCFARQTLEAARFITDDPVIHERVIRSVLRTTAEMDLTQSPVIVAQEVHRHLRNITGVADPYREVKDGFNRMALNMAPGLSAMIARAADPLYVALRLAIAGNVIDLGVNGHLGENEAREAIETALDEPFHGQVENFRQAVSQAQSILYLADNAGEIVFDRLLIEQLPTKRVTVAVRGAPVLNDATLPDAEMAGLCDCVQVIDNGSDAPGTVLEDCSDTFLRRFTEADLVIAKGQGNFEALSEEPGDIYFLLKAKCPVIADHLGLPVGTHVATGWQPVAPAAGGEHHAHV
jgi:damage-control phosphatase, subfamily I